jgi:glycosyltransferase involved in cell wall biosynthesis
MLAYHWSRGTWTRLVDQYIAITDFARRKFIEAGLPADKIAVKPNFVPEDPGLGQGLGGYAVYVGRLSVEKGVRTLLDGWARLRQQIPLRIAGDGPLAAEVRTAAARDPAIQWLGRRPHEEVLDLIGEAKFLVFPSNCYETFGLAIVESFAKGTPVIASGLGARSELVTDGRTGLLFRPGDPRDLAAKAETLWNDGGSLGYMRGEARDEFEKKYTAQENYRILTSVYDSVLNETRLPADDAAEPIEIGEATTCP